MKDDSGRYFVLGLVAGVLVMICLWWFVADEVEKSKVKSGYLTFYNKTYSVTLYDSLDVPEKTKEE